MTEQAWSRRQVLLVAFLICLATLILHLPRFLFTSMIYDDLTIVIESWPWNVTWQNLWLPANEHAMPWGRITTALMVEIGGSQSNLPRVLSFQGPIVLLLCMWVLYLFVRRELGHPVYGLIAMAFFGVTTQYVRGVSWFSAAFALFSLLFTLLGLLAAQSYLKNGSKLSLALCGLCCFIAPGWFAIGVLTGSLCSLYLLWNLRHKMFRRVHVIAIPTLCTGAFFVISLMQNAEVIMNLPHYRNKTAAESFDPLVGLLRTGRSLIDHKLLGSLGVPGFGVPRWIVIPLLPFLILALFYWYRFAPRRGLFLLGLAFLLGSDLMIQSARANWEYEGFAEKYVVGWTRYQLYPHLGLTLMLLAGLPRWEERLLRMNRRWLLLLGLMVLCHGYRAMPWDYIPDQAHLLHKIQQVDERARRHRIGREAAIRALSETGLEPDFKEALNNAWHLLRGSDDPRPMEAEKIRKLLLTGIDVPLRKPLRIQ